MQDEPEVAPPAIPPVAQPRPDAVPAPEIQPHPPVVLEPEPAEPEAEPEPLPELVNSDPVIAAELAELIGIPAVERIFNQEAILQHLVATIDNLPRRKLARKVIPVKPATGEFTVEGDESSLRISADNSARYAPFVAIANEVSTRDLVDVYQRYYPLLEQAYQELGYPDGDFNARLVEVIDHLLETPEVDGEIYLVKPEAFYLFEDPDLERLSAGQKALLRTGSENAGVIKSKLEAFRLAISF